MSQCIECAPSPLLNDVASGATEEDAIHALLMLQNQKESSPELMKRVLPSKEDIKDMGSVIIRNIADPKLINFSDQNSDWYEKVPYPGKYMQYTDVFIPLLIEEGEQELIFLKQNMSKFDELTLLLVGTLKGNVPYKHYEQYLKNKIPHEQLTPEKINELAKAYVRSIIWKKGLKKLKENLRIDGIHIFKAEWCGYCQLLQKQAPDLFYPENKYFCVSHEQSLSQYSGYIRKKGFDISGYPTIYFLKGNQKKLYEGERNFKAILQEFRKFFY